eukprot:757037-Hanusia_phi.AAC.5
MHLTILSLHEHEEEAKDANDQKDLEHDDLRVPHVLTGDEPLADRVVDHLHVVVDVRVVEGLRVEVAHDREQEDLNKLGLGEEGGVAHRGQRGDGPEGRRERQQLPIDGL